MKIVRGRTKAEVEMTLASDALGSPDIAPFRQLRKAGCFGTGVELISLCRVARVKAVLEVKT